VACLTFASIPLQITIMSSVLTSSCQSCGQKQLRQREGRGSNGIFHLASIGVAVLVAVLSPVASAAFVVPPGGPKVRGIRGNSVAVRWQGWYTGKWSTSSAYGTDVSYLLLPLNHMLPQPFLLLPLTTIITHSPRNNSTYCNNDK